MAKLWMMLVILWAPTLASWSFGEPFRDNQALDVGATAEIVDPEIQVDAEDLKQISPPPGTENLTPKRSTEAEEPEEAEAEPEGSWTIGEIQLITLPKPNPPLKVRSAGQSSLQSYNFVGKVGGISFEQVAVPDTNIATEPIHLSYDHEAPDGTRLVMKLGSTTVRAPIADWLLIPIARFADSQFTAATSLFGEGPDTEHYYYFQYHPAFQNTLLGLRLLQADIFLMHPSHFRSLPKRNGHVVLGHGEHEPSPRNDINPLIALNRIMGRQSFTSYILTDTDSPSRFFLQDETLQIQSLPHYYFWKRNDHAIQKHQRKVVAYNQRVDAHNRKVTTHKNLINQFNSLARRFNANNASVPMATLDGLQAEIERGESELVALEQELDRLQMDLKEGVSVNPVPALTKALKSQSELLQTLNPLVYQAVHATAGYAAFFRYVKFNHPQTWNAFLKSIGGVKTHPSVKTPTHMPRKNL